MKHSILYINGSFINDSGSAVIAENTYRIFKNKNHEVAYFTTKEFNNDEQYEYAKYFPTLKAGIYNLLKNPVKYYYNQDNMKKLEIVLDKFQPSIVHVHSLRIPSLTYSVLRPIIKRKLPIVMTLHDAFLICPTIALVKGNGYYCSKALCKGINKLPCIFNNCANAGLQYSFNLSMMSFVNKMTGFDKYVSKFITPSDALRKLMLKHNNDISENNIVTINNFLSDDEIKNISPNYNNHGYFLYIGRLSKEKGVHYLLEAMKDLPKEIKLHVVGKGPEEENLKQYAAENNLGNVEFCGFKNREEIKEEYQNCIATILPCNWFENFPTTNMESFINGKPVIASNIGGIPEQIEHNKTGLLFEPANVAQLKECVLKYWNNIELVIEHGQNAYEKATKLYTEEKYYTELMNVYKEVLNSYAAS